MSCRVGSPCLPPSDDSDHPCHVTSPIPGRSIPGIDELDPLDLIRPELNQAVDGPERQLILKDLGIDGRRRSSGSGRWRGSVATTRLYAKARGGHMLVRLRWVPRPSCTTVEWAGIRLLDFLPSPSRKKADQEAPNRIAIATATSHRISIVIPATAIQAPSTKSRTFHSSHGYRPALRLRSIIGLMGHHPDPLSSAFERAPRAGSGRYGRPRKSRRPLRPYPTEREDG